MAHTLDLETFVEHAGHYAWLERRCGRQPLLRSLDGHDSLRPQDADEVADFLDALSEDLSDEVETARLADSLRKIARGG